MMRRLLTVSPDNEALWVRLYVQPYADRWAAMLVGDEVLPPDPGTGLACFCETPAEVEQLAWAYRGEGASRK